MTDKLRVKPTPDQVERARNIASKCFHTEQEQDICDMCVAKSLADEAERARMEERERCARVAENGDNFAEQGHPLLVVVAAAIRQME